MPTPSPRPPACRRWGAAALGPLLALALSCAGGSTTGRATRPRPPATAAPTRPRPAPAPCPEVGEPDPGPMVPFELRGGRVRGLLPESWLPQDPGPALRGRADREALQRFIPYPETDDSGDSANALLAAFDLPPALGVREFSQPLLGASLDAAADGAAVLRDDTEGAWRLVLARARRQGTPYALLWRFGAEGGVGVSLLVAVPLLPHGGNEATVARILAQFRAVADSLALRPAAGR